MPYTTQDIRSNFGGKIYAPVGVWVDVIGEYGSVLAVEYLGDRFPCSASKLADKPPIIIIEPIIKDEWKLF